LHDAAHIAGVKTASRKIVNGRDAPQAPEPSPTASDLAFARRTTRRHFWRGNRALPRGAYGALIVYAALAIAMIAIVAIRVAAWVPAVWR
jgi:hypothetical protein